MGNQKWTIQRNWQLRVHKTKTKKNTTQCVLDTTIRKQTMSPFKTLPYMVYDKIRYPRFIIDITLFAHA